MPPGADGLRIARVQPGAYGIVEARPRERHGTAGERRIARFLRGRAAL